MLTIVFWGFDCFSSKTFFSVQKSIESFKKKVAKTKPTRVKSRL